MSVQQYDSNDRIRLVLDSAPMTVTLYDEQRKLIDCNMEAVRMFGYTNKEQFISTFAERSADFFPLHQPCGISTSDKLHWLFNQTAKNGRVQIEWEHLTCNGEELPTEVTFIRVDYEDTFMFVAYIRDLREIKVVSKKEKEASDMVASLLKASPLCIEVWEYANGKLSLVDCNEKVFSVFGISTKEEYINDHFRLTPKFQPCGTPSEKKQMNC